MANDKLSALILGINKAMGWLQITTHGSSYTCPIKEIDGVSKFKFKNKWHIVYEYVGEHTTIMEKIGKDLITRKYKK